jgi:hypothetical protein
MAGRGACAAGSARGRLGSPVHRAIGAAAGVLSVRVSRSANESSGWIIDIPAADRETHEDVADEGLWAPASFHRARVYRCDHSAALAESNKCSAIGAVSHAEIRRTLAQPPRAARGEPGEAGGVHLLAQRRGRGGRIQPDRPGAVRDGVQLSDRGDTLSIASHVQDRTEQEDRSTDQRGDRGDEGMGRLAGIDPVAQPGADAGALNCPSLHPERGPRHRRSIATRALDGPVGAVPPLSGRVALGAGGVGAYSAAA